jgi:hypothetical protein
VRANEEILESGIGIDVKWLKMVPVDVVEVDEAFDLVCGIFGRFGFACACASTIGLV